MAYSLHDEQDAPRLTPAVQWIIAINVAIFFLQKVLFNDGDMWRWLGFDTSDLSSPASAWAILTYMFVHGGFWHLALNMYSLYVFGPRVEHAWGSASRFTMFYLWCGLGGWLFHILFARHAALIGASAAIFGVMLAYAMRWPDDEVLFMGLVPMKVKWLVAGLAALNLAQGTLDVPSGTAYFAHLGGFAFGFLWLRMPSGQSLDRLKQRVAQVPDIPDETPRAVPRSLPRPRERQSDVDEVVAKSKAVVAKRPAPPAATIRPRRDARTEALDMVLDKISRQGLDSLTPDERRLLEEMSKRLKDRE
jgi:membrane associated rhomboid family serine protease